MGSESRKPTLEQLSSPQMLKQNLPTMYDLPSHDPREPGLPDEFHDLQPELLSRTLRLTTYPSDRIFKGTDLNLYYDSNHPLWHKRPDWFLVVDVPRLYAEQDSRSSYVVWDEQRSPTVIVELLSPGREAEDLGIYADETIDTSITPQDVIPYSIELEEDGIKPPHKWIVYEQILQVPYYIVFSRYSHRLRVFQLIDGAYQEQHLDPAQPRAWLPTLQIGIGVWQGEFDGIPRAWLRWYDAQGNWCLTDTEQERQAKEQAQAQLLQAAQNLLSTGMDSAQVATLLGLSDQQINNLSSPPNH
jgi:Uma2 family endonuclease